MSVRITAASGLAFALACGLVPAAAGVPGAPAASVSTSIEVPNKTGCRLSIDYSHLKSGSWTKRPDSIGKAETGRFDFDSPSEGSAGWKTADCADSKNNGRAVGITWVHDGKTFTTCTPSADSPFTGKCRPAPRRAGVTFSLG